MLDFVIGFLLKLFKATLFTEQVVLGVEEEITAIDLFLVHCETLAPFVLCHRDRSGAHLFPECEEIAGLTHATHWHRRGEFHIDRGLATVIDKALIGCLAMHPVLHIARLCILCRLESSTNTEGNGRI